MNERDNANSYPDGFYLWQYKACSDTPVEVWQGEARVPVELNTRQPSELIGDGMTLTLLIPASEVVYQALTIYTILCGVDDNRIEAAELLDKIKAAREAQA